MQCLHFVVRDEDEYVTMRIIAISCINHVKDTAALTDGKHSFIMKTKEKNF